MVIEVVEKVIRVYEINCASVEEAKERALQCHKLINRKKAKKTKVIEAMNLMNVFIKN